MIVMVKCWYNNIYSLATDNKSGWHGSNPVLLLPPIHHPRHPDPDPPPPPFQCSIENLIHTPSSPINTKMTNVATPDIIEDH